MRFRALDRVIGALILAALLIRPAWAVVAPRQANLLRCCASLRAREPVDPWGSPWMRVPDASFPSPPSHGGLEYFLDRSFRVGSMGPDRRAGTADDVDDVWLEMEDSRGDVWIPSDGDRGPEAPAMAYRLSPGLPLGLAVFFMLVRWRAQKRTWVKRSLAGRFASCAVLAVLPTLLGLLTLAVTGALVPLLEANPTGMARPVWGAVGALHGLCTLATFLLRDGLASRARAHGLRRPNASG